MGRINDILSCGLAVALAVLGAGEVNSVLDTLGAGDGASATAHLRTIIKQEPPFGGARRVTVLLIGADRRPGDAGRSDSLLVLFVNPQTRQMALLGIPRDLRVSIPGRGRDKINHAYPFGGPQLVRRTVEGFLGRSVDYHAVVFFEGFERAVDALGGVWVDVPDIEGQGRGMNYDDDAGDLHIHLQPGRQHLDGRAALGFVRYRKSNTPGLGDSDEARSGRQQQFLRAMAEQHLKPTSLPGLLAAGKIVTENVETDMPSARVPELIRALHGCDPSRMFSATVPLRDSNWEGGRTYYAYADERKLSETLAQIDWNLEAGEVPRPSLETLNACGITGRAADAGRRLARTGFSLVSCANADQSGLERTLIEYQAGHKQAARLAASVLGCGTLQEAEGAAPGGSAEPTPDIRVYLGSDYEPEDSE